MALKTAFVAVGTLAWMLGALPMHVAATPAEPQFTISCLVIDAGSALRDAGWTEQVGTDVWYIVVDASDTGHRIRECVALGGEVRVSR